MNTRTLDIIKAISKGGKIFKVSFIKKDNTERTMVCRFGVTKHLCGGVNPCAHMENIITVFNMQKNRYRNINIETIKSIKGCGKNFTIE
jgi:hypothetical protein